MAIELQILGSNSAAFAHNRHHTSQLLRVQDKYFLIDCGEGTQLLIKKHKIKLSRINEILISHLHGDHYYGLMGLISTLHLYGRKADLCIYGPPGLAEIITLQLRYSMTRLSYDIKFKEWTPNVPEVIFDNDKLRITTIPLDHRIPCSGFLFEEKAKKRGINKNAIKRKLTPVEAAKLRNGEDLVDESGNVVFKNEEVTFDPKPPYSYAYCSDTRLIPELAETIKGVDLVYHESTFMHDMHERAASTYHTTARQAAELAEKAEVRRLLLGHFSTRYKDLSPLLREARSVFSETYLAEEGKKFVINH
ncbi:ribonuclease Z [Marinoscillum furvescens]|uniref:Ribonuclease Z n=1 Tax=Marinoscillum furvescens DSM 4134 TaxID=1122208 RepID=A0A3D9KXP1_MARFU|nr:ribonuclease Z [Marinoscillum furvescens]RED93846.1 RNAse Z [Marinoscillum furvescens DSM 4134]